MKLLRTPYILLLILITVSSSFAARPTKVIGAGLNAAVKTPFHLTAGTTQTLSKDTIYILTGFFYIDSLATLTIQPGTVIYGDSATFGTLIVRRGGRIYAEGTAQQPIVFTSKFKPGNRKRGDWGGIILLGNAPTNKPITTAVEGIETGGQYGGNNPNDTTGVLRYVRIEFPGIVISLNNEINGLTMGGVGKGTVIENIQVSYSNDDSFEWFGGTVDARHLVAWSGTDDDFDSDFGYSGRIQFGFSKRDPNFWDAAGQSNSFESDNDGTPTLATPLTSPVFSNMTVVGPQSDTSIALPIGNKFEYGAVIRRNTKMSIHNSIMAGYPFGISIRNDSTAAFALQDLLQINNVSVQGRTNILNTSSVAAGVGFNISAWFTGAGKNNTGSTPRQSSAIGLVDVFNATNPDPRPTPTSEPATAGTSFSSNQLTGGWFTTTSYRGAFDPSTARNQQWDFGWTNYNPQATDYSDGVTSVQQISLDIPTEFSLEQNYPNPFNPTTKIKYSIQNPGITRLRIFDVVGKEIATVFEGYQTTGSYETDFNASGLSSGVYFYALQSGSFMNVKKMLLLR